MIEEKSKREILIDSILEKTNKYTREEIEKILDSKEEQIINVVLNQTNMDRETAKQMLEENDFNSIKVIKQHFGIKEKQEKKEDIVNVNQQVYKEIRNLMDTASKQYRIKKELEQRREDFMKFLKERESKTQENKLITIKEDSNDSEDSNS
jgi:hypothetical protein